MQGIYFGRISSANAETGKVRVAYNPPYDTITDWLPLLMFEYDMPEVGTVVAIIVDDYGDGVCLGKVFSNEQKPATNTGYYKKIGNAVITANGDNFKIQLGGGSISISNGVVTIDGIKTVINNYDGACTHND